MISWRVQRSAETGYCRLQYSRWVDRCSKELLQRTGVIRMVEPQILEKEPPTIWYQVSNTVKIASKLIDDAQRYPPSLPLAGPDYTMQCAMA